MLDGFSDASLLIEKDKALEEQVSRFEDLRKELQRLRSSLRHDSSLSDAVSGGNGIVADASENVDPSNQRRSEIFQQLRTHVQDLEKVFRQVRFGALNGTVCSNACNDIESASAQQLESEAHATTRQQLKDIQTFFSQQIDLLMSEKNDIRNELSSQIHVLENELETERKYASVAKKEYDVEISNLIEKLESQHDAAADRQTELEEANQMLCEAQRDFDETVAELSSELRLQKSVAVSNAELLTSAEHELHDHYERRSLLETLILDIETQLDAQRRLREDTLKKDLKVFRQNEETIASQFAQIETLKHDCEALRDQVLRFDRIREEFETKLHDQSRALETLRAELETERRKSADLTLRLKNNDVSASVRIKDAENANNVSLKQLVGQLHREQQQFQEERAQFRAERRKERERFTGRIKSLTTQCEEVTSKLKFFESRCKLAEENKRRLHEQIQEISRVSSDNIHRFEKEAENAHVQLRDVSKEFAKQMELFEVEQAEHQQTKEELRTLQLGLEQREAELKPLKKDDVNEDSENPEVMGCDFQYPGQLDRLRVNSHFASHSCDALSPHSRAPDDPHRGKDDSNSSMGDELELKSSVPTPRPISSSSAFSDSTNTSPERTQDPRLALSPAPSATRFRKSISLRSAEFPMRARTSTSVTRRTSQTSALASVYEGSDAGGLRQVHEGIEFETHVGVLRRLQVANQKSERLTEHLEASRAEMKRFIQSRSNDENRISSLRSKVEAFRKQNLASESRSSELSFSLESARSENERLQAHLDNSERLRKFQVDSQADRYRKELQDSIASLQEKQNEVLQKTQRESEEHASSLQKEVEASQEQLARERRASTLHEKQFILQIHELRGERDKLLAKLVEHHKLFAEKAELLESNMANSKTERNRSLQKHATLRAQIETLQQQRDELRETLDKRIHGDDRRNPRVCHDVDLIQSLQHKVSELSERNTKLSAEARFQRQIVNRVKRFLASFPRNRAAKLNLMHLEHSPQSALHRLSSSSLSSRPRGISRRSSSSYNTYPGVASSTHNSPLPNESPTPARSVLSPRRASSLRGWPSSHRSLDRSLRSSAYDDGVGGGYRQRNTPRVSPLLSYSSREDPVGGLNALCESGSEQDNEESNSRGHGFSRQSISEGDESNAFIERLLVILEADMSAGGAHDVQQSPRRVVENVDEDRRPYDRLLAFALGAATTVLPIAGLFMYKRLTGSGKPPARR